MKPIQVLFLTQEKAMTTMSRRHFALTALIALTAAATGCAQTVCFGDRCVLVIIGNGTAVEGDTPKSLAERLRIDNSGLTAYAVNGQMPEQNSTFMEGDQVEFFQIYYISERIADGGEKVFDDEMIIRNGEAMPQESWAEPGDVIILYDPEYSV